MVEVRTIARGLRFPEGPVAMADGSVVLVELARGTVTRIDADGSVDVVAEPGGGPNGAALGPDGRLYVCNNGGSFSWHDVGGLTVPGPTPDTHEGGRIERVDLRTGEVEVLYEACDGRRLRAPNDLVFDHHGGFWFTDHGTRTHRHADLTGVFYARADGSAVTEVVPTMEAPNGIGLSPAGDRLYVAETYTGRVWAFDLAGPGELAAAEGLPGAPRGASLLAGLPGFQLLDSLAVEEGGNVCVGTLVHGGITVIPPDGTSVEHVPMPDVLVTNLCFGGDDRATAYVTCSGTGTLVATAWPRPGLAAAHHDAG